MQSTWISLLENKTVGGHNPKDVPVSYQIQSVCIKEKQGLFNELFGLFVHDRVLVADVSRLVQIGKDGNMIDLPPIEKR